MNLTIKQNEQLHLDISNRLNIEKVLSFIYINLKLNTLIQTWYDFLY